MIITRTPFRIPLGGGGTDLPAYFKEFGGYLITAAVNKYMYISLNAPAVGHDIKINYSRVEIVTPENIGAIRHNIVRESLRYLEIRQPMEISSMADIPAGTGLGSSSAYAVGFLHCLNTWLRRHISTQELAEEASMIEIDRIGKPIGKQDQYAVAFGGINVLTIDRNNHVTVTPLRMDPETLINLEHSLLLFYTKIRRDADAILEDQNNNLRNGHRQGDMLSEKALRSMHEIKEIGQQIGKVLLSGDIHEFGRLLHAHWIAKKRMSEKMTSTDIDSWYELALANGAIGGKIMGAGGGGFFLFCCAPEQRRRLRAAMEKAGLHYTPFHFDFEGSKVLTNF